MNKKFAILMIFCAFFALVGYSPRPYSDLAEYKRLPMSRRIERMQKAGEEFFLRRKYEEALTVFENILALDDSDMKAKLWITKTKTRLMREQNEVEKQNLFRKYGQLIPEEMTYYNWHWGPTVGHFEVKYSEPKPYVPPVRKFHPKASDAEIKEQQTKAEKSNAAADYFELAMRYWSRKEQEKAIKAYFTAVRIDPEVLANDDELLLATAHENFQELIASGKAKPREYLTGGRVGMIQGDRRLAMKHLINAAALEPELKSDVSTIIASFITSPGIEQMSIPADIFSYRQAYVYDQEKDMIYLRLTGMTRNRNQIFPLDVTLDLDAVSKIELQSKDVVFAYAMPGMETAARLWFVLPEMQPDKEFEIKVVLHLNRKDMRWLDLSNFSVPLEQPDNWAFVIGSEFNFSSNLPEGEYKNNIDGVQIVGYHLSRSDGKGPYLVLEDFKEPMPKQLDIWQLMQAELQ